MKVKISERLEKIYIENHKNYNYALSFLLSSIDLDTFGEALNIVDSFVLNGEQVEVDVDEQQIKKINNMLKIVDDNLVEKLLWIAVMFPEI